MTIIKNVKLLSAQRLFELLKLNLEATLLPSLMLTWPLTIRINDLINIFFPEIIEGVEFTVVINAEDVELSNHTESSGYDTTVMEQHLQDFLNEQCS